MTDTSTSKRPSHAAYQVRDRGENQKAIWTRVGAAWPQKGGGFSIQLDSVPLDGRIVLRPAEEKKD